MKTEYRLRLKFRGKDGWQTTVLPQRIARRDYAENAAKGLRSHGALVEVVEVREEN